MNNEPQPAPPFDQATRDDESATAFAEEAQQLISEIRASISADAVSETYQESLDRVASRNDDISGAAKLLGASDDGLSDRDPGMEQEMKALTGEDDR